MQVLYKYMVYSGLYMVYSGLYMVYSGLYMVYSGLYMVYSGLYIVCCIFHFIYVVSTSHGLNEINSFCFNLDHETTGKTAPNNRSYQMTGLTLFRRSYWVHPALFRRSYWVHPALFRRSYLVHPTLFR